MIIAVLDLVVGTMLHAVALLLSTFNFVIPPEIQSGISGILGYLNYFGGVINLSALSAALSFFVGFLTAWWTYKIILSVFGSTVLFKITHPQK